MEDDVEDPRSRCGELNVWLEGDCVDIDFDGGEFEAIDGIVGD